MKTIAKYSSALFLEVAIVMMVAGLVISVFLCAHAENETVEKHKEK